MRHLHTELQTLVEVVAVDVRFGCTQVCRNQRDRHRLVMAERKVEDVPCPDHSLKGEGEAKCTAVAVSVSAAVLWG